MLVFSDIRIKVDQLKVAGLIPCWNWRVSVIKASLIVRRRTQIFHVCFANALRY